MSISTLSHTEMHFKSHKLSCTPEPILEMGVRQEPDAMFYCRFIPLNVSLTSESLMHYMKQTANATHKTLCNALELKNHASRRREFPKPG